MELDFFFLNQRDMGFISATLLYELYEILSVSLSHKRR